MACSSVMPGGGTNLELALHCLHEAQGDIQVRRRRGAGEQVGWLRVALRWAWL